MVLVTKMIKIRLHNLITEYWTVMLDQTTTQFNH